MSMWAWRQRVKLAMANFAQAQLPKGKRRRDWKAKAGAFGGCGRTVAALGCSNCGNVNLASGTIVATCGLRICPICARRRAERLRHRLRAAWDKSTHGRRDEMYFLTLTLRYDPGDPDEVSAAGLLRRKNELLAAWSSVWRQYLKKRAHAACRAIEVGGSGMIHLHVLYLGRRPDVGILRARWMDLTSSPIVNIKAIRRGAVPRAIVELAKYVTKGASPAKVDVVSGVAGAFMDPELAVRVEIAFSGDRIVQCYGAWLGISVDDDEDDEVDEAKDLWAASCPHCGLVGEWHAQNFRLDEWLEKYGAELDNWRPRIGGSGPRKKNATENEERSHDDVNRNDKDQFERVRARGRSWSPAANPRGRAERRTAARAAIGDHGARQRDAARVGRPAWTASAARLDPKRDQRD
jgi:hypothetical protein